MNAIIRLLDRLNGLFRVVEEWSSAIMIVLIVIGTAMGVFWRYVLRDPLSWPNEFALFLFLWIVFLSASTVARDDGHFKVGFFIERRSERTQHIVNLFLNVLKLFFLIVFIHHSMVVFPRQAGRRMTAVLGVHKGWHTFALTVGFSLMALTILTDSLKRIVSLGGGKADVVQQDDKSRGSDV